MTWVQLKQSFFLVAVFIIFVYFAVYALNLCPISKTLCSISKIIQLDDAKYPGHEYADANYENHGSATGIYTYTINNNTTCRRLFEGDEKETEIAKIHTPPDSLDYSRTVINYVTNTHIEYKLISCYAVGSVFPVFQTTDEEANFPLAFSIVFYKDVSQVERLLRAIYRPHNYYCLHVDQKAKHEVYHWATSMAECFDNVFVSSNRVNVNWGFFSVVEADIMCMEDLIKHKYWKYFINLTGQEFPLKTNLEMVQLLKSLNGTNAVAGHPFDKFMENRIKWVHKDGKGRTRKRKKPFEHNISMAKGMVHVAVSREFVEFALHDPVAIAFREWCRDTGHGSEHYFNSLHYSPQLGTPGSQHLGENHTYIRWKQWEKNPDYDCQGKIARHICIPGVGDLPALAKAEPAQLFVNKIHQNFQPMTLRCLEENLYTKTLEQLSYTVDKL